MESLLGHPVVGSSWEGMCIEQLTHALPGWRASFYRTSSGEEIDLVMEYGGKRLIFECKASMSPKLSNGFRNTVSLLKPDGVYVLAPVKDSYELPSGAHVCNPKMVFDHLENFV